ncbi:MAG: nucleotide exchange factor GrpE [Candidatus Levybacteria bacterium]|nr:nucleotide exchange factor GrpE [Candidatus Levybacteria bacterium]
MANGKWQMANGKWQMGSKISMNDDDVKNLDLEEEVIEEGVLDGEEEKVSDWEHKYKRALADYQNLEKRVRDDRRNIIVSANKDLLLRFLPVLDTLELANHHEPNQSLVLGINQCKDILKSEGVLALETVGEDFDPNQMEVVSTAEGKEGIVIQEVRKGYLLHDILLRPAQVIVGKGK